MTLTTLQLSEPFGQVTRQEAGTGTPVVLIHGVGMRVSAWGPQVCSNQRASTYGESDSTVAG